MGIYYGAKIIIGEKIIVKQPKGKKSDPETDFFWKDDMKPINSAIVIEAFSGYSELRIHVVDNVAIKLWEQECVLGYEYINYQFDNDVDDTFMEISEISFKTLEDLMSKYDDETGREAKVFFMWEQIKRKDLAI